MQVISTNNAPQAIGPYSQGIVANGLIFTSGQIALDSQNQMSKGGIEAQTRQVLENLVAILNAQNSALDKVIKTTIFLADMGDFAVVNEIYAEFFGTHKPARSTVAVKSLPKDALIEIECIACC